ncbi:CmcI family methyltransferase [Paenibacillus sp. A3]|uniref:CmcI family methyltransferase n=1 Tax=Paenibacillus sp. A3 TaxID=1337054 RepID=UPI0006D5972D|nr:CmcI family methyltransferase [Paenibacillus sp. A3]
MSDFIDQFHRHYYDSLVWQNTRWLGVQILKMPLDLMIYQEIVYEVQPDLIIESGTFNGGSTLFFASMLELIGKGRVVSIDVAPQADLPVHPRITYVRGSSTDGEVIRQVNAMRNPGDVVLVNLDSDHSAPHVLSELRVYSHFVTTGSYLIVEDTNIHGHPVLPSHGPGPMEALDAFLQENDRFAVDESRHKFFVTFNPRGYLRKIK